MLLYPDFFIIKKKREKICIDKKVYIFILIYAKRCGFIKHIFIYDKSSITEAKNNPLTKEVVIEKFSKTGNTDYELNHINVYMDSNVFLPISELNNFRRKILDYDFS